MYKFIAKYTNMDTLEDRHLALEYCETLFDSETEIWQEAVAEAIAGKNKNESFNEIELLYIK